MPTQSVTRKVTAGGVDYTQTATVTASQQVVTQETIDAASTDVEVALSIDVSAVKSLYIQSTADVTIETNDGSSPADTLAIKADEPYLWTEGDAGDLALGTDVTSLFVTNAGSEAADLTIALLQDASP